MLISVIVVIDITEKNEDFIKSGLSAWVITRDFYFNFIPYMANMISTLLIFIATVFVTAVQLASHSEIIAILSSGVSFKRFLFPFFIGSLLIAIITFALIGWVIPKANKKRIAFENTYLRQRYFFEGRDVHIKIAPNVYAYMESYNNTIKTGYQFTLETIVGNELQTKLKSDKISWDEQKKKWVLENYTLRKFNKTKEILIHGLILDTILDLHPADFESKYELHTTLTMDELNSYIKQQKLRGAENIEVFLTEKYERYAYPFAVMILTIIGVIVSSRKSREGAGFQIAFGFMLAFVYIIFVIMSRNMVTAGGVTPLLAAWLPNLIFSAIGFLMYKTVPR